MLECTKEKFGHKDVWEGKWMVQPEGKKKIYIDELYIHILCVQRAKIQTFKIRKKSFHDSSKNLVHFSLYLLCVIDDPVASFFLSGIRRYKKPKTEANCSLGRDSFYIF